MKLILDIKTLDTRCEVEDIMDIFHISLPELEEFSNNDNV